MDQAEVPGLLSRMASDEDAARKMAVFKLQSSVNDPSFADVFISMGGLQILRRLIMNAGGNTLAYSLTSLSRLLEIDMGWDIFEAPPQAGDLCDRIVELIVTNPLVNILRGAMSILVALVSHSPADSAPGTFGSRALRPAIAVYPQFFEIVVQKLHSADHALCATTLTLLNALIRDAVSSEESGADNAKSSGTGEEWPKFVKRLQDLGLIRSVYSLMQSPALQDLAHPLLEFQSLTKVLLRKWREVKVDLERQEHRRALKSVHLASAPNKDYLSNSSDAKTHDSQDSAKKENQGGRHNPEKWRRLGFETESPAADFQYAGFLGMMDLTDWVRKNEDTFQKILLEQSTKPLHERCPIARASLAVTLTVFEFFECGQVDIEDTRMLQLSDVQQQDKVFRPLLLQWSRLHTAGLQSFLKLWQTTGAVQDDFEKIVELVRVLFDKVLRQASRQKDIAEAEEELGEYDISSLRECQMETLSLVFEEQWGKHFDKVRENLKQEALTFVKEQRVRCLLQGAWFSKPAPRKESRADPHSQDRRVTHGTLWRYAKLSHNRRYLHWADFALRTGQEPGLDVLTEKLDLKTVTSVSSNVSQPSGDEANDEAAPKESQTMSPNTSITIFSYLHPEDAQKGGDAQEHVALALYPLHYSVAAEWFDGLLMLLDQTPITADTSKLIDLISDYGLKIRLLKLRSEATYTGPPEGTGVVPSREGLDDDYYYTM